MTPVSGRRWSREIHTPSRKVLPAPFLPPSSNLPATVPLWRNEEVGSASLPGIWASERASANREQCEWHSASSGHDRTGGSCLGLLEP